MNKVNQEVARLGIQQKKIEHIVGAQCHGKLKGLIAATWWEVDFEKFWDATLEDQHK
jgi:hypothetical protein